MMNDRRSMMLDLVSSKLRMEIDSMPMELDEIERKLRQYEKEKHALKRNDSMDAREKLSKIAGEMAELQSERDELRAQWLSDEDIISKIREINEQTEKTEVASEPAEREGVSPFTNRQ
jgi:ATP-dependent Clp protease ATP-binding subunit ClpB